MLSKQEHNFIKILKAKIKIQRKILLKEFYYSQWSQLPLLSTALFLYWKPGCQTELSYLRNLAALLLNIVETCTFMLNK